MNVDRTLTHEQVEYWANESLRDPLALTFSNYVSKNIDWGRARFHALVNADLPDGDVLDFRTGGKVAGTPRPEDWLVDAFNSERGTGDSFLLIEDWTARPGDAFLIDRSMPAIFSGNEVYYVVKDERPEQLANWHRICSNTVPLFHGFLIQGQPMLSPGDTFGEEQMEAHAKQVQMIFFGIYDGESYLLCSTRP